MEIGGLQKTTLIDYPGKIAATVFLIGCNFRCPFCYSSELVLPEKIKQQPRIKEEEFFSFLKEKRGYLDGVVICGGEPTIQPDLEQFLKKIKKMNFLIKIDTNGSQPEVLKKIIDKKLIDYIAMDIKAPLREEKYNLAAGCKVNLEAIRESINLIKASGIDYEFRTTIVPTIHTFDDIIEIAKNIAPAKRYYLQNFKAEKTINPQMLQIRGFSEEEIKILIEKIKKFFEECKLR
ncbi:MAG: anaerobic ribonucleoside-triphosphate reductase activating protein [Patescibacteria group bacterium]|jgi:pyruvate formate lyase activating enzyme|nr:anaerobic ribonucleoside-triphosphate reductase activating protein [Patescibacteria group bacterium]